MLVLDNIGIGKNIARLRKERGWTQQQLADKLDVGNKAISKWENGRGIPDIAILYNIAKVFGVSTDEILCEVGERAEEEAAAEENLLDEEQLQEQVAKYAPTCVRHKILQLDEVIKIKNRQVIKALLDKYPISYVEYLNSMLQQGQYREIYRFAIDCDLERLAAYVTKVDDDKIRSEIFKLFEFDFFEVQFHSDINWNCDETTLADLSKLDAPTNYEQLREVYHGNIKYVKYHINGVYIGDELIKRNEIHFQYPGAYERAVARELNILKNCRTRLMTVLKETEGYHG